MRVSGIFILFSLVNTLMYMDHGTIPAASNFIRKEFDLTTIQLGTLGSLLYLGLTIGGISSSLIFYHLKARKVLIVVTILMGVVEIVFPFTSGSKFVVYLVRFFTGMLQVFFSIYGPVWIDVHSPDDRNTLWMTYLQITSPVGIMAGYILTSVLQEYWYFSFILQGFLLFPIAGIFMSLPSRSIQSSHRLLNEDLLPKSSSFFTCIKEVILNGTWLFSMLALTCMYFIVTGIQYWGNDYALNQLGVKKEILVPLYSIIAITGPSLGLTFGGWSCHKLGGYNSKSCPKLCLLYGCIAFLIGLPIPFFSNPYAFLSLLWILFFFGGSILPGVMGIMISSIKHKAVGNSISIVCSNVLGYFPAPFVYGVVAELSQPCYGMMVLIYTSIIAFGCILIINLIKIT